MRQWLRGAIGAAVMFAAATALAQAGTGQLVISTTPAGADISIDGKPMGKAPLTARDLLPGDHFVEATWPGGKTASSMQRVDGGASRSVQLSLPVGNLVVISQPPGAELLIDGNWLGKAPMTAADLPPGDHRVTARWPGGASLTNVARVIAGSSSVIVLRQPVGSAPLPPAPLPPAPPPPSDAFSPPPPAPPPPPPPPAETAPPPEAAPPPVAAPPPPAAPPPRVVVTPAVTAVAAAPPAEQPVYKKWWLWTIVGVVVVGAGVGLGVGLGVHGGNSRYGIAEF